MRASWFAPVSLCLAIALCPGWCYGLVITEIMYHPAAADEAAVSAEANLEWIEIYNEDAGVRHLTGYRLNGVDFTFPPDTYLEGKQYLVLCADEASVRTHYGITNTIGNFLGRLDNDGEKIELIIFGGGAELSFSYRDRGRWPHAADGTGHSLAIVDLFDDPDDADNWIASPTLGGTPGEPNFDEPTVIETAVLDDDEIWSYRKGNSAHPAGWQEPGFDDSSWLRGRTGIGYGDDDDRTALNDMSNGYWSFAARHTIELTQEDLDALDNLALHIDYDDGFVFWVNGEEVARGAMGAAGSPVAHDTPADLHEADGFESFSFSKSVLNVGENVLACQINNNSFGSSDASFIPRIVSTRVIVPTPVGEPVPVAINEVQFRDPAGGWIELINTSPGSVDLTGFWLSDDRNEQDKYALPEGSTLPPNGFLTITEADSGLSFTTDILTFYLSRPTLTQVVTAGLFENSADESLVGFSEARAADGRFFSSATPTPGATNEIPLETDLVISEIMYHPPEGREGLEFVEVANRGTEALDLTGFRFTRGVDFAFPDGTTLNAGAYAVIAKDPPGVESAHGITDVLGPYEGFLSDSGERIRIVDPIGNIADEVRYHDGGRWAAFADGGGSSLELLDLFQDNSVASAWDASDESGKSEWEEFEFQVSLASQSESEFQIRMLSAGECLIDDITMESTTRQYISNGSFESSTSPWRIHGNHVQSYRTTDDAFAGNASLRIIATGDGDLRVNRIEQDTSPSLTSGSYTVHVALRWLRGANIIHFSGYRQPTGFQVTQWMSYPANLGSPAAANSVAVDNLGPVISQVSHSPAVPAPSTSARILARVSDFDGVRSVFARYRTGSLAGSYSSAELFDDGAHDDGAADDGIYGGELPPQSSGTKVVYHIQAEDDESNTRRFPRNAPDRGLVFQHDNPFVARGHALRLIDDDTTWGQLNSRQLHSNELVDATFIFDDKKAYYNVGTRFRGSPWNRPPNPRMYRIRFNKDDRYRDRRSINISRYGTNQRDRAAHYSVWRNSTDATPSPMSRGNFARFRSSSGTWTMEQVDPVNGDYLSLWFPEDDNGTLFKILGKQLFDDSGNHRGGDIRWADYQYRGTNASSYRWNYSLRTREIHDDYSDLAAFLRTLSGNNSVLDNELENHMDVEQFWRVYAARCAHDDWDTISIGNGQNAYIYFASGEGRWKLLPWDMDHSWDNDARRVFPDRDARMQRVLTRPKYRRMYVGILNEMINGRGNRAGHWTTAEMVSKYLDRNTAAVGSDGVANANQIRDFIGRRTSRLQQQIPAAVGFEITTNGGDDLMVNDSSVRIDGDAWIDVHQIVVNDQPIELTWVSTTRWRAEVELGVGENDLTFFAFNSDGNFVDSDAIRVTSTLGWNPPQITSIGAVEASPGETVEIVGVEFHDGIRVFFGGVESEEVAFSEENDPDRLTAVVPVVRPGSVNVTVQNVDGRSSEPSPPINILPLPPEFVRGDVNLDRRVDLSDPISILAHLFDGLAIPCRDAADVDDSEDLSLTDAVVGMSYLFKEGPAPTAPFPEQGLDASGDALDCLEGFSPYE